MQKKVSKKRGRKGTPWFRKFNNTRYFPCVDGQFKPIVDSEGYPVKGR